MKNKKAFTIVEVLAVVVLLGVLATIALPTIQSYVGEARIKYNNELENQLLISGKAYFSDNKKLIPKLTYIEKSENDEKSSYVSVSELYTNNYLKKELVDYDGNNCAQSYVAITKNSTNEDEIWHSCLICNKVLSSDPYCEIDINLDDKDKPSCQIKEIGDKKVFKSNNIELKFTDLSDPTEYNNDKKYLAIDFYNKTKDVHTYLDVSGYTETDIQKMDFKGTMEDEGTYSISILDKGLNKSDECISEVVIDNTAPKCEIETRNIGNSVELKSIVKEPIEQLHETPYSWKGKNERTEYSVNNTYIANENYEYISYVKDKAGNEGYCSATILSLDTKEPNAPILSENMIPVYYDYGIWRKADDTNTDEINKWYDYHNKMWANSVTVSKEKRQTYLTADPGEEIPMEDILTMQVWIPRYKYKVWNYSSDGSTLSNPQEIDIRFENGTATTGEISCTDNIQGTSDGTSSGTASTSSETCKLKATNEVCTAETCNGKTYTHPAFTFGTKELEGMWVGKFEVGTEVECTSGKEDIIGEGCNLETIKPLTKPDIKSWRGAMISVFENNIMAMNNSNNQYGFASTDDTHVIKNIEWGAVAYLSHSKYGTCTNGTCSEIYINNSSGYYTGRSGGNAGGSTIETIDQYPDQEYVSNLYSIDGGYYTYDDYKVNFNGSISYSKASGKGTKASTTGNVYGIYDMIGGASEYVMANLVSPDGKTMITGHDQEDNLYSGYSGTIYWQNNKIAYKPCTGTYEYPNEKYYDKYSFGNTYTPKSRSKLGDGIKEVFYDGWAGWYDDYSNVISPNASWQTRGASNDSKSGAGIFSSGTSWGDTSFDPSSRIVITQ